MKKLYFLLLTVLLVAASKAQVSVTATAGTTGPTAYTNLSSAFAAINAGTHQGAITIDIQASFTDAATAVLNSSGAGAASYTSINIRPTADGVTMSFASASGRGVIELNGADNVTIDGDNPNTGGINRNLTITNTATNAITFTSVIRIASSTLISSNDNNTFKNLNLNASGTGMNAVANITEVVTWGIIVSGNASTTTASTAPSALTSATTLVPSGQTVANLTIDNNNIQTASRGISVNGSATTVAPNLLISNNVIGNATAGAANQVWGIGITAQGSANLIIRGNTIRVEGYVESSTVNKGIDVGTISTGGLTGATIDRNIIERVVNSDAGSWPAVGINIVGGTGHIIQNNFVETLLNSQVAGTGAFSTTFGVFGIRIAAGTGHKVLHNSVNMTGTIPGSTSTDLAACLCIVSTTSTGMDIRNNIFANKLTGGNTTPYNTVFTCVYVPSITAMTLTMNNNAYYQGSTAYSGIGQVGTTGSATNLYLYNNFNASATTPSTNWRAVTSAMGTATNDNSSFAFNTTPPFVSPTDLHIPNGTATVLESSGAAAGVAVDIDNQARSATTPDVGADEFTGVFVDVVPPSITYTPLGSICNTSNRTLSGVTITDAGGVPTAGALRPRIYYKKNAGSYFSQPGTLTSGTGNNGTWDFTIVVSDMGGVATGDVISYYVIAQDNAGNISSSPSGVVATDVNTVTTPPASPNTYTIGTNMSGTYTVGVGGNYTTLTAAVAAYNANCLSGPVVFSLTDATYPSETFPIQINQNAFASAVNTLTIKPASGVTATISGSSTTALIKDLGNYVIIDGSNNGTTSRNLTITNTSATTPSVYLIGSVGTTPIVGSTLKNTIIINGVQTSSAIVVTDATTLGNAGYFNNITIQNNSVQKAYIGIYCNAIVAAGNGTVNLVNNDMTTSGANAVRLVGCYVQGTDGATITGNQLANFEVAAAENKTPIWMATGAGNTLVSGNTVSNINTTGTTNSPFGIRESSGLAASGNIIRGNTVSNITSLGSTAVYGIENSSGGTIIEKNNVSNIQNNNTGTWGAYGIDVSAGNNTIIRNNFVSNINENMTGGGAFSTTFGVHGIRIATGTGHKVYHNSVNMYGIMPGTAATSLLTSAFTLVSTTSTGCDVRNNIFANNISGGTTSIAHVSVYLPSGGTSAMTLTWNNNAYFFGPDAARQGVGQAGTTAGTNFYTTLAALTAYTSTLNAGGTNDNKSSAFTTAVPFVSATDLHIDPASANCSISNSGAPVGVADDIDNQVRNALTPDIGADEFTSNSEPTITLGANPAVCTGATTANLSYSATTNTPNQYSIDYNVAAEAQGFVDVTNAALGASPIVLTVPAGATPGTYTGTLTVRNSTTGCVSSQYTITVTINPNNTITLTSAAGTNNQTVCINTPITNITYSTTGATGATFAGLPAGVTGNWAANVVTISGTPTASGTFNYTVTLTGGCGNLTATGTINVTPNNTITLTSAAGTNAQTVCINTPITNITYSTTGATGATFAGLPAGVTGNWAANVVTISGTPTASGTFNYTVTLTGGCGNVTANGSITVNPNNTITRTSAAGTDNQAVCINSAMTPITYATTGATGATFAGLPAGVSGSWAGNVVTINGTPTGPAGTYNYTVTLTGGCGNVTATGTIFVRDLPSWTVTLTQPSTCAAADGAITLNMTGPGGPYTFAWTGPGVNPTAQNQTNLTVGVYVVTVTVNATGCQSTQSYTLTGPGGCFVCPTLPNVTTNPTPSVCTGSNVTITSSGMTNMGITYGVIFKYYNAPTANPYAGGTTIATIPPPLPGGGTTASTTTSFATAGTYYIYAIVTPTPIDPSCRPSGSVVLTVNYTPTFTVGTSPTVCSGTTTTYLPYTSTYTTAATNLIQNGGFETGGTSPWVVGSAVPAPVVSGTVSHSGTYSWALGKYGAAGDAAGDASGYQTITIPAEGATLSYWYLPTSTDVIGNDWQDAYITNTSGTILQTIMHVNSNSGSWTNVSASLNAYAGQTIRVMFLVHNNGNGLVTNMYLDDVTVMTPGGGPSNYSIVWSAPAPANGFTNVTNQPLPASPIPVAVPAGAAPGTYTGTITVTTASGCSAPSQTFTVTINPIPVVNQPANQVVCNNAATAAVNFTTPTTGPGTIVYNWFHTASGIGLANNGTGNIPSFTAVNNTSAPVVATITVIPTYTYNGVSCTGQPKQFTITINPTPTVNQPANQTVCHNTATAAVNFTGFVPGTVYNWTNNTTSIGLAASGTGNIPSFTATNATAAPVTATITVTPSYTNGAVTCTGTPVSFTITVNPIPGVNPVANQVVCNGSATTAVIFTSPTAGTTYTWTNNNTSIGLQASGVGNIPSFTAINPSPLPVTATITVTPSYTNNGTTCTGTASTFTITVNASPTVSPVPSSQVVCNGSTVAPIFFNGPVSGAFYTWTNNQPSIGLAASGTTNTPSFVATNTGTTPVVATITVTGNYTNAGVTCSGPSVSFTITVNPTPTVNAIANQTVCNGTTTTAVTPSGTIAGTVYTWTNSNTSIGLAAGGSGTIPAFTALNNTGAPVTATVTVTPSFTANGLTCFGTPTSYTYTVNPAPTVNGVANQTLCAGSATNAITFSGAPAGTVYSWTNSNTAIGLAASGTGNIPSFTATNAGNTPITGTITVTTSANACGGGSTSFTITVNPTATVNAVTNQTVCNGSNTAAVTFGSNVAGATFTWTNNNTSIGLGASGIGNIPSFTAYNPTTSPITATITVNATMVAGGVTCTGPARTFTITVSPSPNITFTNAPIRVCLTDTTVLLTATPAGGVWSGPGVVGNTFTAANAGGTGVKVLSYTVTSGGCSGTSLVNVTVNDCLERHNILAGAIRIWPNPSTGKFSIRFNTDIYKEFKMDVIDSKGAVLKHFEFSGLVYGSIIPMDLRSLPNGYYRLVCYNSQEKATFPFIIGH